MTSNHKDINDISLKISDIFGEQADNWSEVVKKEVDKSLETVASNIQDVHKTLMETRAQAAEQREKENRRNYIVIYNIPESRKARAEDRYNDDTDFCLQLFNNVLQSGMEEDDVINIFRLGQRGEDAELTLLLLLLLLLLEYDDAFRQLLREPRWCSASRLIV